jgi:Acetyltransferase (GNAT) domain
LQQWLRSTTRNDYLIGLVPLAVIPFAALAAYDRALFPAPRERFLAGWTRRHHGRAIVEAGELHGYGVIRRCRVGWKIGPLFADDSRCAEALFAGLAAQAPAAPIFIDVPQPNAAAIASAERHGMTPCFETARMYTGIPPGFRWRASSASPRWSSADPRDHASPNRPCGRKISSRIKIAKTTTSL